MLKYTLPEVEVNLKDRIPQKWTPLSENYEGITLLSTCSKYGQVKQEHRRDLRTVVTPEFDSSLS